MHLVFDLFIVSTVSRHSKTQMCTA